LILVEQRLILVEQQLILVEQQLMLIEQHLEHHLEELDEKNFVEFVVLH
jgi:hypothetical protein